MITALIPARGGSKRVPLKNVRSLGGQPLIDWSIQIATKSPFLDRTIISTESSEIVSSSNFLRAYLHIFERMKEGQLVEVESGTIIHKRSEQTANDQSKTFSIIEEILQGDESVIDDLLLLQPTSPFRSQQEIGDLIRLREGTGAHSVFSVRNAESPHPNKSFELDQNGRPLLNKQTLMHLQTPEQELPQFYAPDGAFYFLSRKFLKEEKVFVNSDSICFVRTGARSINIDTELDLKFAQFLIDTNSVE